MMTAILNFEHPRPMIDPRSNNKTSAIITTSCQIINSMILPMMADTILILLVTVEHSIYSTEKSVIYNLTTIPMTSISYMMRPTASPMMDP